ncbi:hypothetical protein [Pleomorphomonas sp. NRK KF1]|uniref:hypothetical protein n=1 Tax=Pleomorphomonas sp. NRK KF1 TaxID=2943000 RepID=UPI002043D9A0|nr:hypothetical protein [Pleomorphomonas sp. NRK KF1]MCM5552380.1 hypothetical protein [Pleomorphomonas sp. NRK KF1]
MIAKEQDSHPTEEKPQVDIDIWRTLKNALRFAIPDEDVEISESELRHMLRFFMEQIEKSGLRVVPMAPTTKMHLAMKRALDEGMGGATYWVRQRTKQRWRYQAAMNAAPNWRNGYEQEKLCADK